MLVVRGVAHLDPDEVRLARRRREAQEDTPEQLVAIAHGLGQRKLEHGVEGVVRVDPHRAAGAVGAEAGVDGERPPVADLALGPLRIAPALEIILEVEPVRQLHGRGRRRRRLSRGRLRRRLLGGRLLRRWLLRRRLLRRRLLRRWLLRGGGSTRAGGIRRIRRCVAGPTRTGRHHRRATGARRGRARVRWRRAAHGAAVRPGVGVVGDRDAALPLVARARGGTHAAARARAGRCGGAGRSRRRGTCGDGPDVVRHAIITRLAPGRRAARQRDTGGGSQDRQRRAPARCGRRGNR